MTILLHKKAKQIMCLWKMQKIEKKIEKFLLSIQMNIKAVMPVVSECVENLAPNGVVWPFYLNLALHLHYFF